MNKKLLIFIISIIVIAIFTLLLFTNRETIDNNTVNNMAVNGQGETSNQNSNVERNQEETSNQDNNNMEETAMKLKVDNKEIDIVVYDTEVGKDILSRLPYKATISNSGVDLCGDAGKNIKFDNNELTRKVNKGDIVYL